MIAIGVARRRDRLLGLLWPDRDERTARHLLADSLYVLRRALGPRAIAVSGETVRLARDVVWSDVAEFRRAVAGEQWSEALALYRGDFLDGFYLRNAIEFDQWALGERHRLRGLAGRCATALAMALEEQGRLTEAAAAAERALELAPWDEAALRRVVRLLTAGDNRARADAVARAFIERVASELGVAPSRETMQLVSEARGLGVGEPIVVIPPAVRPSTARRVDSVTASIILQGRHHWHQRTRTSVELAITYFTRATERDPRAAAAWCGLADAWSVMGGRGYAPVEIAIERAKASLDRAIVLGEALSSVHAAIGCMNIIRRRWRDAVSALHRAIHLDPHNADAHHWLALALLTGFGDRDGALREQTIAVRLNPLGSVQVGILGWQQYLRGQHELSRSHMEPAVHLNADFEEGHAGLARAAARLGDEATVMSAIEAGLTRRADLRGDLLAEQASALAVLGDVRRARRLAAEAAAYGGAPINLAPAWAGVGDAGRAFEQLERESFLVYWAPQAVWWDPRFDDLRSHPRFVAVRERVARVWDPEWQ